MATDDSGQMGSYDASPPPPPPPPFAYAPPPRQRSPWLYIGIGCLAFIVLGIGGCVLGLKLLVNRVQSDQKQPITAPQVVAAVQPLPVYPKAQVDLKMSKAMRSGFGIADAMSFGQMKFSSGVFAAPADAQSVIAWYEKKMPSLGWNSQSQAPEGFGQGFARGLGKSGERRDSIQRQYSKGQQQVVIQATPQDTKSSTLFLFKITRGSEN